MTHDKPVLEVSVFSDYICPFCYIGSRRLLRLADEFDLRVNWCGTELHPETPPEGMRLSRLGYASDTLAQMMAAIETLAREEGLEFAAREYIANSHQALLLAEAAKHAGHDIFYALHEGLFHGYFARGQNIGDKDVLRNIALESQMPPDLVEAAWSDQQYERRLHKSLELARHLRIHATPTFIFAKESLVGAVPYAQLKQAATRVIRGGASPA